MSKSTIKRRTILLFVFVISVALIAADLVVFAQNSNGQDDQTRGGQMTSNGNNTNTGRTGRRRRRGRRTTTANTGDGTTNMSGDMSGNTSMQGNANTGDMTGNMSTGTTGGRRRRRRRSGGGGTMTGGGMTTTTTTTTTAVSEQTDLSGTYTGTLTCAGIPISGEGTLTITGNQYTFTPTGGGASGSGRIVAVTTRGYTAVAMQFGESVAPPPGGTSVPPVIISLRARRAGDRLTLSGVPNTATSDCSFTSGGGTGTTGGRRRRRGRRNMGDGMTSTTTSTTDTGTATGTTDTGTTTTTGTGGGRRRRGRRSGNTNTNANSGGMGNMNMNR
ncbi:MAG: hypothetical protein ICV60_17585 [Pyrinomonadaceae bacterium]|nr:hypothetical protein [Pyrinomonadaceae bacterium]